MHLVLKICPKVCLYAYLDLTQKPQLQLSIILSLSLESNDDLLLMNPPPLVFVVCVHLSDQMTTPTLSFIEDVAVVIM